MRQFYVVLGIVLLFLGGCSKAPLPTGGLSQQAGLAGYDTVTNIDSNTTSVIITGYRVKNALNRDVFIRSFTAKPDSIKFAWEKSVKNVPSPITSGPIALDTNGNSYTVRRREDVITTQAFLRKYSPTGNLLWEKNIDQAYDVAVDSANNVYIPSIAAMGIDQTNGNALYDISVTKLSSNGVVLLKTAKARVSVPGTVEDFFLDFGSLKVDQQGTIYVSYYEGNLRPFQDQYSVDFGLIAFETSGTLRFSRLIAANTLITNIFFRGDFSADNTGNIFVIIQGNKFDYSCYDILGPCGDVSLGTTLYKLDRTGKELWKKIIDSDVPATTELSSQFSPSIIVDADQSIYVAGEVRTSFAGQSNLGKTDVYAMKLNASGNRLWVKQFGTADSDSISDIAIKDGLYVAGALNCQFESASNGGVSVVYDCTSQTLEADGFLGRIRRSDGQGIQIITIR